MKQVVYSLFYCFWRQRYCWTVISIIGRPKPDWDTRGGEECIERDPKTMSNTFFQGGAKICSEEAKPPTSLLATGPIIGSHFFVFHKFLLPSTFFLPPLPYRRSGVPVYNSLRKNHVISNILVWWGKPERSFPYVRKPADKSPSFMVHQFCLHAERRTMRSWL